MPEDRYFTVTEERQIKVAASSTIDAAIIADTVFRDKAVDSIEMTGRILTPVRVRDLVVREDF